MSGPDLPAERDARLTLDIVVYYGIIGFDLDGVITSWNAGAEAMMGWSADEAIGQPGSMIFVPEDVAAAIPASEMSATIRTGRGIDERWHLKKDGSRFWANGEMMPMRSEDGGSLKGFVKVMRDRTEQHQAAVAREATADRFRMLHDEMEEGFCLIQVRCDDDAQPIDYRFLKVNAAFERHTGLKDAAGSWMRELAPDHEQHWFDVYARIARTGKAARFELPARALGRHYEVFAFRVGDPADRVVAILFSDITLRRTEASRLRESEQHLRSLNSLLRGNEANLRLLLDTIDEGFYAVDRHGVTTTCNAAFLRMMNYDRAEDVIGRKLHGILHHSHPDGSPYRVEQCPIYRCAADGTPAHVRGELFFPVSGEPLWVEYRTTPVIEDGELQGAICTFRDLTLERRREEERTWAERRRAALLELGDGLRNLQDPAAMAALAAEVVGRTLDASAAGLGRIDGAAETLVIDRDWAVEERFSVAGRHPMRTYGSYIDDLVAGRTVVIRDVGADPRTAASQPSFEAVGVRAFINVPIIENGRLAAILCVLSDRVHEWQADEVAFVQEVAERTRAATERRRAEVDLQRLNERLEREVTERTADRNRLWQLSTDLMLVAAFDGSIEAVNPAWTEVLGWTEAELIGQPIFALIHPDDVEHTVRGAVAISEGTSFAKFENRYRHKDGSYRDIVWTAGPATIASSRSAATPPRRRRRPARSPRRRASSGRRRRWRRSASSPAASPTTSTTC
jgi:PAS domain S-box-containing protein